MIFHFNCISIRLERCDRKCQRFRSHFKWIFIYLFTSFHLCDMKIQWHILCAMCFSNVMNLNSISVDERCIDFFFFFINLECKGMEKFLNEMWQHVVDWDSKNSFRSIKSKTKQSKWLRSRGKVINVCFATRETQKLGLFFCQNNYRPIKYSTLTETIFTKLSRLQFMKWKFFLHLDFSLAFFFLLFENHSSNFFDRLKQIIRLRYWISVSIDLFFAVNFGSCCWTDATDEFYWFWQSEYQRSNKIDSMWLSRD